MSYRIIPTHRFEKEIKRLVRKFPSLKNEFSELINAIQTNPEFGIYIGNQCYKIRLAIRSKGKGKSGGARVITYLYLDSHTVYLLTIYDKSENEDIHPTDLKDILESLDLI